MSCSSPTVGSNDADLKRVPAVTETSNDRHLEDRSSERKDPSKERKRTRTEDKRRLSNFDTAVLVSRVIDGDTIEVTHGKRVIDVRLIGVDTPETVHPTQPVECLGPAASRFTTNNLEGKRVQLEFDQERRDHYGRTLGYIWTDGQMFNELLVVRGLATVSIYSPNDRYESDLVLAESIARKADRGVWKACPANKSAGGAGPSDLGSVPQDVGDGNCTPDYSPCLPPASDYDCTGGEGNGPEYASGPIRVSGSDPYQLDADGDGTACES